MLPLKVPLRLSFIITYLFSEGDRKTIYTKRMHAPFDHDLLLYGEFDLFLSEERDSCIPVVN